MHHVKWAVICGFWYISKIFHSFKLQLQALAHACTSHFTSIAESCLWFVSITMADGDINLDSFEAIASSSLSSNTTRIYNNKLKRIRDELIVGDENMDSDADIKDINPKKLLQFVEKESKHNDGKLKTHGTPEAFRNALMYYYRKHNLEIPHEIEVKLAKFVKGVRNLYAAGRQNGTYKATEGKDVLDFQTYEDICAASLKAGYCDGHLYMILMWNMTCRSNNAESLNCASIQWSGDCMTVTIE